MKCTITSAIVFVVLSILFGGSYAFVSKGLVYFSAGLFQTFRMLFSFVFTLIIVAIRYVVNANNYRQIVKSHFTGGIKPVLFLLLEGLINLGIPHCLIAVAQKWVRSADVQLMQPFSTATGAVFAHFVLSDERFTLYKLWSLLASLVGVILCGVPAFNQASSTGASTGKMALGYFLVLISICLFGFGTVLYKWKTPNVDVTVGVAIQLFASVVWNVIWMLIFDSTSNIKKMVVEAPMIAWLYPVLVGVLVSGAAVQGFMWLINELGSFGSNLVPFGQIIVGVIVGVAFLHEWENYKWWEILLCCVGMLFLCVSLGMGFYGQRKEQMANDMRKEDEKEKYLNSDDVEEDEDVSKVNEINRIPEL